MSDILRRICDDKREHVAARKAAKPLGALRDSIVRAGLTRGFAAALARKVQAGGYGLIAEIKKASPSAGLIRPDFDPAALATAYQAGGAACLSVLTDEPYFQGADEYLADARASVDLPCLRKDFLVDLYQVYESRALGADCILLILAALEDGLAAEMEEAATELGMDVLIEVHDEAEFERALKLKSSLIGVNNRNLKTMVTDIGTTERLAAMLPEGRVLVAESGLKTPADLSRMARVGARRFLIGESIMRQGNVEAATRQLLADPLPLSA
ncbi:indole-3-glycerol phosphate synthase TrpC [Telmatospirillum sp. J64-1]|uniref:indole-3-glycerol phosphate synthase TrpC n=1 Tax=Telmatospirillum sp. J64-1 TaxID=2502183 RepID=UPI00115ECA18|nr:indole-3-glycerol phosphate synthase TrpC [Telmatospirillum sp. J64-1]